MCSHFSPRKKKKKRHTEDGKKIALKEAASGNTVKQHQHSFQTNFWLLQGITTLTEAKAQELGEESTETNAWTTADQEAQIIKLIFNKYGYVNHFCHSVKMSEHRKGLLTRVGKWMDNLLQPEKGRETTMLCLSYLCTSFQAGLRSKVTKIL